jgi:hypothetical protein
MTHEAIRKALEAPALRYAKAYEARIGAERYINSVEDDAWIRGQLRTAQQAEAAALSALLAAMASPEVKPEGEQRS